MKNVVLKDVKKLEVEITEKPLLKDDSVLVEVKAAGICGSDIHYWNLGEPKGLVFGHEFSGVVVDGGKSDFSIGDRVTALPLAPCYECEHCKNGNIHICPTTWNDTVGLTLVRSGGYGEYLNARINMTVKIPDTMSFEEAAMIEPVAVSYRAANLANIKAGDKVLIVGGGIIGLLAAEAARLKNPSSIVLLEPNKKRAAKALEYGIVDEVFDPSEENIITTLWNNTNGGFDSVIECVGNEVAVDESIKLCKSGKTVVLAGVSLHPIPISTKDVVMRELILQGTICYTKEDFITAMELIENNKINVEKYISKRISLDEVQESFSELTSGIDDNAKIIIKY